MESVGELRNSPEDVPVLTQGSVLHLYDNEVSVKTLEIEIL